jgi:hypothetical protein
MPCRQQTLRFPYLCFPSPVPKRWHDGHPPLTLGPFPVPWQPHHQLFIRLLKQCQNGCLASTIASSYRHTPLYPIKTNHLQWDSSAPKSRLVPYSPLSDYAKLLWRACGSQESGTYRLLHRDQLPAASLHRLTGFFFIGTDTPPPLFGDCQLGSRSHQHDILLQTRRLGRHWACHSDVDCWSRHVGWRWGGAEERGRVEVVAASFTTGHGCWSRRAGWWRIGEQGRGQVVVAASRWGDGLGEEYHPLGTRVYKCFWALQPDNWILSRSDLASIELEEMGQSYCIRTEMNSWVSTGFIYFLGLEELESTSPLNRPGWRQPWRLAEINFDLWQFYTQWKNISFFWFVIFY